MDMQTVLGKHKVLELRQRPNTSKLQAKSFVLPVWKTKVTSSIVDSLIIHEENTKKNHNRMFLGVADGVIHFVTGVRAQNFIPDHAITAMEQDDAINFENISTCIDNMNFMYPEIVSGVNSFTSFNEFV
ncbi:Hypothetical predicted protein [Paramuricea clavata]|uniref:Uncharacterized protein n=1 Tax=Paramuricea clavata TaxID=317549 RepID=A0A7D9I8F0_PARCT|nr:Hypothetical predicted protein [Paramuricea clavata]